MVMNDESQMFLFTFRNNGGQQDEPLVEVLVEQLSDYDPSVAGDAFQRSWFGTREALGPMMEGLGFEAIDVRGVMGALRDHRDADRRLAATSETLKSAGFNEVAG